MHCFMPLVTLVLFVAIVRRVAQTSSSDHRQTPRINVMQQSPRNDNVVRSPPPPPPLSIQSSSAHHSITRYLDGRARTCTPPSDGSVPLHKVKNCVSAAIIVAEEGEEEEPEHIVIATVANAHYEDFLHSWYAHLLKLGIGKHAIVGAVDTTIARACQSRNIHHYPIGKSRSKIDEDELAWGSREFKHAQLAKVLFVRDLLEHGVSVLFADGDVAFIRNPLTYLQIALAANVKKKIKPDMIFSTDSLNDDGALLESKRTLNVGVMVARATRHSIAFCHKWVDALQNDPDRAHLWDQSVANELVGAERPPYDHRGVVADNNNDNSSSGGGGDYDEPMLFRGAHHTDSPIVFGILPARLFTNGHTYFVQQRDRVRGTPWNRDGTGIDADASPVLPWSDVIAVHATHQFSGATGKRTRLKYARGGSGGGAVDDDEREEPLLWYDDPSVERFDYNWPFGYLTFVPPRWWHTDGDYRSGIFNGTTNTSSSSSSSTTMLNKHMALVQAQFSYIRHALGLAVTLGRILILPAPTLCLLDRFWGNLEVGDDGEPRIPGVSSRVFPPPPNSRRRPTPFRNETAFACPLDHILELSADEWHVLWNLAADAVVAIDKQSPQFLPSQPPHLGSHLSAKAAAQLASTCSQLHPQHANDQILLSSVSGGEQYCHRHRLGMTHDDNVDLLRNLTTSTANRSDTNNDRIARPAYAHPIRPHGFLARAMLNWYGTDLPEPPEGDVTFVTLSSRKVGGIDDVVQGDSESATRDDVVSPSSWIVRAAGGKKLNDITPKFVQLPHGITDVEAIAKLVDDDGVRKARLLVVGDDKLRPMSEPWHIFGGFVHRKSDEERNMRQTWRAQAFRGLTEKITPTWCCEKEIGAVPYDLWWEERLD